MTGTLKPLIFGLCLLLLAALMPLAAIRAQSTAEMLVIGVYAPADSGAAQGAALAISQINTESAVRYELRISDDPAALSDTVAVLAMPEMAPPQAQGVTTWPMPTFLLSSDAPLGLRGVQATVYRGMTGREGLDAILVRYLTEVRAVDTVMVIGGEMPVLTQAILGAGLVQVVSREGDIFTAEELADILRINPGAILFAGDGVAGYSLLFELSQRGWRGAAIFAEGSDVRNLVGYSPIAGVEIPQVVTWSPLATDTLSASFIDSYADAFGEPPTAESMAAYDLTWALSLMVARYGADNLIDNIATMELIRTTHGTVDPPSYGGTEIFYSGVVLDAADRNAPRYRASFDAAQFTAIAEDDAIALGTPAPEATLVAATSEMTFTVTVDTLNVRRGPSRGYQILGEIDAGDTLSVIGRLEDNSWWVLQTPWGIGWVDAEFGTLSGDAGALPAVPPPAPPTPTITPAPALPTATPNQPTPAPGAGNPSDGTALETPLANAGFHFGGQVTSVHNAADLTRMKDMGMTWMKEQIRWEPGETPANGAVFPIEFARANDMKVLIGSMGWPQDMTDYEAYIEEYTDYLAEVAALSPDAIEIWNEPNISAEFPRGLIDGGRYANLLRMGYQKIKAANPSVLVISAAPAPTGFFGGGCAPDGCDDDVFLRQMVAAGALDYMDCLGAHFNEGVISPTLRSGDPRGDHHSYYWGELVDLYTQITGGAVPICFTEVGYMTTDDFPNVPIGFEWTADTTLDEHTQFLAEAAQLARDDPRILMMIVWNVNFTQWEPVPMAGFALFRPGGGCPACNALRQVMAQ